MTNTIDPKLLKFVKTKSPALVKTPVDMMQFGCLQYAIDNEYFDEYSNFGWIKYLSKEEAKTSEKNNHDDFSYFINDMGFRGNYPSPDNKRLFAFFGCSITFGQGLPEDKIYANLVSRHYNKQYLNLGIPGSNIHRTVLTFSAATKLWDIEAAIINLPPFTRLHYADKTNHLHSILLSHKSEQTEIEAVRDNVLTNFSDQFLLSYSIDAIQWIIDIARSKNINLILASWDPDTVHLVNAAFDTRILKFDIIDSARDSHPGEMSHRLFSNAIINNLTNGTYTC
jgi:hypothetical protein